MEEWPNSEPRARLGHLSADISFVTRILRSRILECNEAFFAEHKVAAGEVHGVLGLGGLQGTSACTSVMRALPYGLPKVMVSTAASGDTSSYVDIKDVTMMFSVGDLLGLNPFTRKILANAAGAAHGMAQVDVSIEAGGMLSGEHGIGLEKRDLMHLVFSEVDLDGQARLREAFDPEGLFNPAKILPAGSRCFDFGRNPPPEGVWV